jgi:hypothetical protein
MTPSRGAPVPTGSVTNGVAPLPAPPTGPVGKVVGKFPEMANMPTMVADPTPPPSQRPAAKSMPPELAPTALGGRPVESRHAEPLPPMRPSQPLPGGYPVVVGGRPYNSDLAPSDLPRAQRSPYSGDAVQAASVLSPVGDHYPQTDWAAAAARPAKAIPPWMLAALFAGALFIALIVTMVIAKIIR